MSHVGFMRNRHGYRFFPVPRLTNNHDVRMLSRMSWISWASLDYFWVCVIAALPTVIGRADER